jgi:hypothetical protein
MSLAAALVPDNPVPDNECWYRILTNKKHVTSEGTVHYQALKGNAFSPSDPGKPWAHELSGRIVALAGNAQTIVAHGQKRVEETRQRLIIDGKKCPGFLEFVGVACRKTVDLRITASNRPKTDVIYTPGPDDSAHADVVTHGTKTNEEVQPVRDWLITLLHFVPAHNVKNLVDRWAR